MNYRFKKSFWKRLNVLSNNFRKKYVQYKFTYFVEEFFNFYLVSYDLWNIWLTDPVWLTL